MVDERLQLWPPYFDEWSKPDQVAYLQMVYQRHELMEQVGRRAGITSLQDRELDPSNCRFSKAEIAELALHLGVQHDKPYPENSDQ